MKLLFDWLRLWRQSKSSKTDDSTKPSFQDHVSAGDMHTNSFSVSKHSYNATKPDHHYTQNSLPIVLPSGHHHHHHHHHHHDMRLLKSCRVTPVTTTDEHEDNSNNMRNNDGFDDDDDVDIEFSTMMMASFTTITRPSLHRAQDTHLTSATFSPNGAKVPHSQSMPKAHSLSPHSPAPNLHLPPRHSEEGPSLTHSLTPQGSPIVHPLSAHAKKSSRMPRSPLLRVLGRPPLPDSSSARAREQVAMPRSPLTHATRHPPASPMSSTARQAKDHPSSVPQSPSTRSSKTPCSPSIQALAYPAIAPRTKSMRAMERQLKPPSPKVQGNAHGLTPPLMCPSSGLDLPLAKGVHTPARTYQPLCCSSGTCILECHVSETPLKKTESQAHKKSQPKKPVKYGMTIVPSKDGPRVRRLSFKNGKWILDEPDYVVLEL